MRFEVLGPLVVSAADERLELRAAKQRLLLAVLLTRPGHAVSVDRLADALWGDESPEAAERGVAWHVHKLRRTLRDEHTIVLTTDGYAVDLDHTEIDARRFETLSRRADDADPGRTAGNLTRALALWRGPEAFGDLSDHPAIRGEARRLGEARLTTLERRLDADLACGHHGELIGELTALTGEHPTRERFRAQLMTALYRCGRQADALSVYRCGREYLIEELGIEPGQRLRELEQAILRNDPALEPSAPRTSGGSPAGFPAPAELPPAPAGFTGREAETAELTDTLTGSDGGPSRVGVISGGPGVGKSALAVRLAHRLKPRFPDGQLYAGLHGATSGTPRPPEEVLAGFLRSLGVTADAALNRDELAAKFRSATAGKRLLILLDDAHDTAQVRPLLPGTADCGVLITSRRKLATLDGALRVGLRAFTAGESRRFLETALGAQRAASQTEAVAELAEQCGHLPLALRLAASRLALRTRWPVTVLTGRLADENRRLTELEADDRGVAASFAVSYAALLEDDGAATAARLFALLGLHPGTDIDVHAASSLLDADAFEAGAALDVLCDSSLLEAVAADRYRVHGLVRLYARRLTDTIPDPSTPLTRLRHHYLAGARNALRAHSPRMSQRLELAPQRLSRTGPDFATAAEGYTWIDREITNLAAVVRQAVADDPPFAAATVAALYPVLAARGVHLRSVRELVQRCVAAIGPAESDAEFFTHLDDGEIRYILGESDTALAAMERALAVATATGNRQRQAAALAKLAKVHRHGGDTITAIALLRRAGELGDTVDDPGQAVAILGQLSLVYAKESRYDEAVAVSETMLERVAELGDTYFAMTIHCNLGHFHQRGGRPRQALVHFERSTELRLGLETGAAGTCDEADQHWGLGEVHHDLGDFATARWHWAESARLLVALDLLTEAERDRILAEAHPPMPAALRS